MIAALAAVAFLQTMTQAELLAEANDLGRSAAIMGACSSLGYTIYQDEGIGWAESFSARAQRSGWSQEVVDAAVEAGVDDAEQDMNLTLPPERGSNEDLIVQATAWIEAMKAKCHGLHRDHAGLIGDLANGDRNADARLAIMLGPIN